MSQLHYSLKPGFEVLIPFIPQSSLRAWIHQIQTAPFMWKKHQFIKMLFRKRSRSLANPLWTVHYVVITFSTSMFIFCTVLIFSLKHKVHKWSRLPLCNSFNICIHTRRQLDINAHTVHNIIASCSQDHFQTALEGSQWISRNNIDLATLWIHWILSVRRRVPYPLSQISLLSTSCA